MDDQDQVDLGDEINERELRAREIEQGIVYAPDDGPSAEELAGALMAQLGYVVADIADTDTVALLVDQDREGLVTDLHALDHAMVLLGTIRDELAQTLAGLMEDDFESIAGHAVKRTKADKVEWDRDNAWRAMRHAIMDRWARREGEMVAERGELVDRVLHDVETVYTTLNPTVKGLQALQVNPYEYRSTTPATRYTVKVG